MAGDWLKMEIATPEKAEVLSITISMGWDDPDLTVGKLFRLWRWFDQQTVDGNAANVTPKLLDRIIGVSGFCDAVNSVGWLTINEGSVSLPNFDRHNGQSAKSRVLAAKRVAKHREKQSKNSNAANVTPALPREEKRREEIKPPKSPKGDWPRFDDFWSVYPRKIAKPAALKAWNKIKPTKDMADKILSAVKVQSASEQWMKDGGQFIPHPATWLNGQRWEDEMEVGQQQAAAPHLREFK